MHLSNRTILITGGNSGIGLELAVQLRKKGNTVIITGRSAENLALAKERDDGILTIQSDASNLNDIKALHSKIVRDFPTLDVLINNAGIMRKINLQQPDLNLESIVEEVSINLVATIRMTTIFLPLLKQKKEAAIVNITSGLAFVPFAICPVYGASKAGLHSFTDSLRMQLQNTGIKVMEVAPPQTKTNLAKSFEDKEDNSSAPVMSAIDVATAICKGMERSHDLVLPGLGRILYWMSRIAPSFIARQISKTTLPKMLLSTESVQDIKS